MPAPSLSQLASILTRRSAVSGPPRVAIARPEPVFRVGVAFSLGLLIALAAGILALAFGLRGLVVAVRDQRADRRHQEREAIPADAVLLDDAAFRRERERRPLAGPVLVAARARALAEAGRWAELVQGIDAVGREAPHDINAASRLLQAEALWRLGEVQRAGLVLHAIDSAALDEPGRARAAELAGRCWLAPQGGVSPPDAGRSR